MGLKESWDKVDFQLELIVDHVKGEGVWEDDDPVNLDEVSEGVREIVRSSYSNLKLSEGVVISGQIGYGHFGSSLYGSADVEVFRETFGNRVRRGVSILLAPMGIPCDVYFKWHQTGELCVPDELDGLVKNVWLTRAATGSFREVDLYRPWGAKKY